LKTADVRNLPIREDAILELAIRPGAGDVSRAGSAPPAFDSIDLELKFEIKEVLLTYL